MPKGTYQSVVLHFVFEKYRLIMREGERERVVAKGYDTCIDTEHIESLNKLFALYEIFKAPINVGRHFE